MSDAVTLAFMRFLCGARDRLVHEHRNRNRVHRNFT